MAGKPLLGVDPLVSHLLAVFLWREGATAPTFPLVTLLASGGHTALYRVDEPPLVRVRELGATRDDAVGEALDKVAKRRGEWDGSRSSTKTTLQPVTRKGGGAR